MKDADKLKLEFEKILEFAKLGDAFVEKTNLSISAWSICEHLDHLLKVGQNILQDVLDQKFQANAQPISFLGKIVLFFEFIPRGKAKAPKIVAGSKVSANDLISRSIFCINLINKIKLAKNCLDNNPPLKSHPYFGGLSSKQWLKFMSIHNRHHFKIISKIKA